jgi:hypothetical protein
VGFDFYPNKMRDFLRFDRDKWIPQSPLNIDPGTELTMIRTPQPFAMYRDF